MSSVAQDRSIGWGISCAVFLLLAQVIGPGIHSPLEIDEQVSYYLVAGENPGTVYERATDQSATPPGYFWLAKGSWLATQNTGWQEIRLRLPSIVCSVGSILLTFYFGRLAFNNGTVPALLLAIQPQFVWNAVHARPYALGTFSCLLSGICIWNLCQQTRWRSAAWIGLLAANLALLWTHYLFALCVAVQPFLWLFAPHPTENQKEAKRAPRGWGSLLSLASLLALFPLVNPILQLRAQGDVLNWVTDHRAWWKQLEPIAFSRTSLAGWTDWLPVAVLLSLGLILYICRGLMLPPPPEHEPQPTPLESQPIRTLLFLTIWGLLPVYCLWGASLYLDPALGQPRYIAAQLAPLLLLLAALYIGLAGYQRVLWPVALFIVLTGAPQQIYQVLQNPVRHDTIWRDAAYFLNDQANPKDLIFTQTGLVETQLVPIHYADAGFQEYCTSRLSDFYLNVNATRLSLPRFWPEQPQADWLTHYTQLVEQKIAQDRSIWCVISADSDVGEQLLMRTKVWLQSQGLSIETSSDNRVATILKATKEKAE